MTGNEKKLSQAGRGLQPVHTLNDSMPLIDRRFFIRYGRGECTDRYLLTFNNLALKLARMGKTCLVRLVKGLISSLVSFAQPDIFRLPFVLVTLLAGTLLSCFAIPISRLCIVLCYALTGLIPESQIILRV